jgi:LacI family transcriptional regulator
MTRKSTGTSRLPSYQRLAELLRERIQDRTYRDSEYLPSERELAIELDVSRQTVRLAIEQLCREGLVQPEHRRGNRVLSPSPSEEVRESGLAALVIYDMSRGASAVIFSGCQLAMRRAGYHLIVCETARGEDRQINSETEQLRALINRRVEGVLLYAEPTSENRALVEEALAMGIAVVQIDRLMPGLECDYVGVDNAAAAQEAVRHLVELGHERIALLTNHPAASAVTERMSGYRHALAEAGLEPDPALVGSIQIRRPLSPAYRRIVRGWMALPDRPSAVFAINDEMAWGIIQALRAEGCDVPGDVSVVGFDNQRLATMIQPPLTTVAQPFLHIGEMGAQLLLDRVAGRYQGAARRLLLPTQLIVRESALARIPVHS